MWGYLCNGETMSCDNGTCGTGDYSGPQPGDPSNVLSLSANVVYGGINVSWSYPTLNPFAVAHTILYRGINDVFDTAIELAVVGGSVFFDSIDSVEPITYFYWIQIVSINGTIADPIGPASTTSVPRGLQTLESLTGRIDNGVLANALKTQIASITMVDGRIADEIQNRINSNSGLAAMITAANDAVAQAMTFVQEETTQRTAGDTALVNSLTTLGAAVGSNLALFQTEQTLRITKDSSYVSNFNLLFAKAGEGAAAITVETNARVNQYGALANRVTTAESTMYGNTATGQVGLTTYVNTLNGKVAGIGALYTAKLSVNGLIGGFGVFNSGQSVEAGFDVDTFWVGRTGPDKVKPFIIDSGSVYIDKARIRNADIDTLKLAGNAVTVPVTSYGGARTGSGLGNFSIINEAWITLDQPGIIYAHCLASQFYGTGSRYWNMKIEISNDWGMTIGGDSVTVAPAVSMSRYKAAGTYYVRVWWAGADAGVQIGQSEMFAMGAKK